MVLSIVPMCEIPALFTRIDSGPFAASRAKVSLTSFWSVTSQAQADAFPPAETICLQVSSAAPRLTSRTRTVAPCAANFKAIACPMPLPRAGHQGNFAVESEIGIVWRLTQSETPLFHGMKSF